VAGPGYGKSTLVARWAETRTDAAWYSLDPLDGSAAHLVRGIALAMESFIGEAPAELRAVVGTGSTAADEDDPARADAIADLLNEHLAERLEDDRILVLDDLQEIGGSGQALRLIEGLLRGAPSSLHLVLISRSTVPFAIERLRGQGQVVELAADRLSFTEVETAALLAHLGDDATGLASRLTAVTAGWPAAIRLAAEALVDAVPSDRPAIVDRLGRPDGPLFAYVAEEVLGTEPEAVVGFLRVAARLDWFDGALLEVLGVPDATAILADLRRRALFIEFDAHDETYAVHRLLRDVVAARLPMSPDEISGLRRRTGTWLEEHGRIVEALSAYVAADDPTVIVDVLVRHGQQLLSEGAIDLIVGSVERILVDHRPHDIELLLADAYTARGAWDLALRALARAGGDEPDLDAAVAWRIALIHHQRGDLPAAQRIFDRRIDRGATVDVALLLSWHAYSVWTVGDPAPLRGVAERAMAVARTSDDDRALAVAYLAAATHANASGVLDAEHLFSQSIAAAERAGWAMLIGRAHNDFGFHLLGEGRYAEALREDDAAVSLFRAAGDASFQALALADRGEAHLGLGHFEEALADFRASIALYDRIGSRWKAWAMLREARLYQLRGETTTARARYLDGIVIAEALGDELVHSELQAGLAVVTAAEDPERARMLVDQAIDIGRHGYQTAALVVAAQLAVDRGDREEAARRVDELLAMATPRRERPAIAAAQTILAELAVDDRERRARLDEAESLWRQIGSPYGLAKTHLVRARLLDGAEARDAAAEAERIFHEIGVRALADEAADRASRLAAAERPPVSIGALGGFRLIRDGSPVPVVEWQSKKARDLLKILVARRGRPIAREALVESLWPDEDPEPLANRLSVALTTVRSVLDPERRFPAEYFIAADKTSVALDLAHVPTDVETFFRLASTGRTLLDEGRDGEAISVFTDAEATYGGDFLEEDPYEDWAVALREEAAVTYLAVARTLAGLSATKGDVDGAIRLWLRILEKDPFDESAHLELVGMLIRAGRHGEARRRYGVYVDRMTEIGVEANPFPTPSRAA
jgi:ATP/maltotriose-dependent transcriptional regulator MalT/DNA-binding SARP family transcriptional activator